MGEDSLSGECDEGQYFDPEALACDAAENVYCALDHTNTDDDIEIAVQEPEPEPESEPELEVELDLEEESTRNTMSTITTVEFETSTITTITTTSDAAITNEPIANVPLVMSFCPAIDNPNQIVLIANNLSCSAYYVCYHGHAIEMHCTSNLHFNSATGQCDYPEIVQCTHSGPITSKCLPYITDFFPHPNKCNYFYYCIRGFLTVQQCPFYYGWDVEKRACVQISQAKCYNKTY